MNTLEISEISEAAFQATDPAKRLFTHEHARRFAVIKLASGPLVMSWRSDLIQPSIVADESEKVVWIAVDERVIAVALDGQVVFSIATNTSVLSLAKFIGGVVAICETEAIAINPNYSIRSIVDFPDIAQDFKLSDERLMVEFAEIGTIEFSL